MKLKKLIKNFFAGAVSLSLALALFPSSLPIYAAEQPINHEYLTSLDPNGEIYQT